MESSNICTDGYKNSKCVTYNGLLNQFSEIEGCVSQHKVNEDLYKQTESLVLNTDVSAIEDGCITYELKTAKDVIIKQSQKITELCTRIEELELKNFNTLDISDFGLDFKCLVDPCGDPINQLGQLLQIIIDKSCPSV